MWLALDQVTDPQNVGAAIRSAVYFGAAGVVLSLHGGAPVTFAVSRASAGAAEVASVAQVASMPRFLARSRSRGWRVLGADAGGESPFPGGHEGSLILVVGNEGSGISGTVRRQCDAMLRIGQACDHALLDSLNVSVAAGILLCSLLRR